MVHHGHFKGQVLGNDGRDDPWNITPDPLPSLQANWDAYDNGTFELDVRYSSGILNTIQSIFNSAIKWTVGSLIDGAGLIIFVGVEVGSLVATGSLVAGARIINNIL